MKSATARAATPATAPIMPAALDELPNWTFFEVSANRLDDAPAELDELGEMPIGKAITLQV